MYQLCCQTLKVSVLQTRAGLRRAKKTFLDSETNSVPLGNLIGLSPTRRTGSRRQGCILGDGGWAKEAQSEFLELLEDVIRQPDLVKSVQFYQLTVDEAKVRLDLAAASGTWLMSSRMVINTERTVAYNSKLWQATPNLKLGLSNDFNTETKKSGSVPHGRRLFKKLTRQTAILPIKFIRRRTGRRRSSDCRVTT